MHLKVAMGLLLQDNKYLLQLRNGKQQIGGLNLIGCFGGKIERGETALQAVCREVAEESSYEPDPDEAELLGEVTVLSDRNDETVTVHATIYLIKVPSNITVRAHEGELVTMSLLEIRANMNKLTPANKACFEQLIKE